MDGMKCIRAFIVHIMFQMFIITAAQAAVLRVPFDYPTIQAAIDAAIVGVDSVQVHDGTYYENINLTKAILVSSANGPEKTIINGSNPSDPTRGSSVWLGDRAVLSGFTVTGGTGTRLSPYYYGGGVYITAWNYPASIRNCIIAGNTAEHHGGGIWITGKAVISDSIIENNHAGLEGGIGGYDTVTISRSTIRNNTAAGYAGGIGLNCSQSCVIDKSNIYGNKSGAEWAGGGILVTQGAMQIINTVISNNTAASGGGIYVRNPARLSLTNCTVRNNSATYTGDPAFQGGGLFTYSDTPPLVVNSIFWGNSPQQIQVHGTSITVRYSDVQGNWPGEGNFGEDPGFKGPMDYHLLKNSPCIDTGTHDTISYPTIPGDDIDGDSRPQGAGIDIGADEYVAQEEDDSFPWELFLPAIINQ